MTNGGLKSAYMYIMWHLVVCFHTRQSS